MDPIEAQRKKLEEQAARRKSGELAKPVRPVPASTPEPPAKNPKVSPLKPATGSFAKPASPPARPAPLPTPSAGVPRIAPPTPPATARPPVVSAPPPRPAALPTPPGGVPRGARPKVIVVVRETAGGDDLAAEVEERLAATKRWILGG